MNPTANLTLCLIGIAAMIFTGMPVFTGKYAVTEASLEALRETNVPSDVVDKIRTGLGGREFLYTLTFDAQLHKVLGTEAAAKYEPEVWRVTNAPLALKDFLPVSFWFLVASGFFAWAYKQPLRRKCEKCGARGRTEKVVATNLAGEKRTMILCPNCAVQVRALIRRLQGE